LEYIPFGEVFIDERPSTSSWSTPYKFNAKELDEETGLYYYGARYYDPRSSVWISVDPLAEITMESYSYCGNNPVNYIDKWGLYKNKNESDKYAQSVGGTSQRDRKTGNWFVPMDETGKNAYTSGGTVHREFGSEGNISNSFNIRFSGSAYRNSVSRYSIEVIQDIMIVSKNRSLTITSTTRTPEDQAQIMYNNILSHSKNQQKNLYGPCGDAVIELFPDKNAMLQKILQIGPKNVSRHCADPTKLNIIDISPSSVMYKSAFINAVKEDPRISTFFYPKKDDAFHLEIKQ